MTSKKALELLKHRHAEDAAHAKTDLYQADQLGLEALEFFIQLWDSLQVDKRPTLPSEEPE